MVPVIIICNVCLEHPELGTCGLFNIKGCHLRHDLHRGCLHVKAMKAVAYAQSRPVNLNKKIATDIVRNEVRITAPVSWHL
jgi:hypothetical protein